MRYLYFTIISIYLLLCLIGCKSSHKQAKQKITENKIDTLTVVEIPREYHTFGNIAQSTLDIIRQRVERISKHNIKRIKNNPYVNITEIKKEDIRIIKSKEFDSFVITIIKRIYDTWFESSLFIMSYDSNIVVNMEQPMDEMTIDDPYYLDLDGDLLNDVIFKYYDESVMYLLIYKNMGDKLKLMLNSPAIEILETFENGKSYKFENIDDDNDLELLTKGIYKENTVFVKDAIFSIENNEYKLAKY